MTAAASFGATAKVLSTFLIPFKVAIKSAPRSGLRDEVHRELRRFRDALPRERQIDAKDLVSVFRMGGLRCRYLD